MSFVFTPLRGLMQYCSPCTQYNSNWSNRRIKICFSGTYWSVFLPWQATHIKLLHFI